MGRFITILEVSQKQAYIFASNKVQNNIINSAVIAYALSPEYIESVLKDEGYSDAANMVYAGGGHTILEFPDRDMAVRCVSVLTENIYREFDGLVVFAKTIEYDAGKAPRENLRELTALLERKKALRASSFRQGSYGIEAVNSTTLDVEPINRDTSMKDAIKTRENKAEQEMLPEGYAPTYKFEDLGSIKNSANFIAVVHIDGNGMGKRVDELYDRLGNADWDEVKKKLRLFSEGIDRDFKNAYRKMIETVSKSIESGSLGDVIKLKGHSFPVRRIITAGDDICFVSAGSIGIECARIFLEKLAEEKNAVDGLGYTACAGVALVHQKYPFYRAYELAEMLCSNAKKYGAALSPADNGRNVSAIDWHIEYGEMKDSLSDIRKSYIALDGSRMELRPYVVGADAETLGKVPESRLYETYKKKFSRISKEFTGYGVGKIKELRTAIKQGETATVHYMEINRIKSLVSAESLYVEDGDARANTLYDAIELMDVYCVLKGDC